MNRGAARQITFRTAADRELFVGIWADAPDRTGIEILAFVLMGNHYHVFTHSPDGQLSETMRYVGAEYTQRFNRRHLRDGALFRGRFHSVLVDSETYFARVLRYIELNPVAAGMCTLEELASYPWSSFVFNSGEAVTPEWLTDRHLLQRFRSRSEYGAFVASGLPDHSLEGFYSKALHPGRVLGEPAFVDKIVADNPGFAGRLTPGLTGIRASHIETVIVGLSDTSHSELLAFRRGAFQPARSALLLVASELADESETSLAERYGYPTVALYRRARQRARLRLSDPEVRYLKTVTVAALAQTDPEARV